MHQRYVNIMKESKSTRFNDACRMRAAYLYLRYLP